MPGAKEDCRTRTYLPRLERFEARDQYPGTELVKLVLLVYDFTAEPKDGVGPLTWVIKLTGSIQRQASKRTRKNWEKKLFTKMAIVESQMSFLEPWVAGKESPYVRGLVEDGFPSTNFVNQEHNVRISDARPQKDEFKLDVHGFAFHNDQSMNDDLITAIRSKDTALVAAKYYPVVENLVKEKTGATKVIIFDHTYRKRDPTLGRKDNPNGREQPATVVRKKCVYTQ